MLENEGLSIFPFINPFYHGISTSLMMKVSNMITLCAGVVTGLFDPCSNPNLTGLKPDVFLEKQASSWRTECLCVQLPVQVMTGAEGQQSQGFSCKCIYSVKVLLALYLEHTFHLVCFMSVDNFFYSAAICWTRFLHILKKICLCKITSNVVALGSWLTIKLLFCAVMAF